MALNLLAGGSRFDVQHRDALGNIVFGRLIGMKEGNPSHIVPIHRLFRTPQRSNVDAGSIIYAPDGEKFLLSMAPTFFLQGGHQVRTFAATLLDKSVFVKRAPTSTDAMTGLSVRGTMTYLTMFDAFIEPGVLKYDKTTHISLPHQAYKVYSAFTLQVNDVLNDKYTVTKVDIVAGICLSEITT